MLCPVLPVIMGLSFLLVTQAAAAVAQTASWLDQDPPANWNKMRAPVPEAPSPQGEPATTPRCKDQVRAPDTSMDRAVTSRGWSLLGPATTYGATTIILAGTSVDGMCRPLSYQAFVFVNGRFGGTLSPVPMDSREDGAESMIRVVSASELSVQYTRYIESDPRCCPSRLSVVRFRVERLRDGPIVIPVTAQTRPTSQ
jgi:hypothetical protein